MSATAEKIAAEILKRVNAGNPFVAGSISVGSKQEDTFMRSVTILIDETELLKEKVTRGTK